MSAHCDLLIKGATLALSSGLVRSDVAVAEGKIVKIGPQLQWTAAETVDATGQYVISGILDSHVHFNEPGRTDWEGIETGSSALAAGGGVAFFDMPLNSLPPVTDAASLELKRAAAARLSRTDFALWGGLVPGNIGHLEAMADAGAIGFKSFMCNSGVEEFERADPATLKAGMKQAAALGMLVAVHAEDESLAQARTAEAHARGTDIRTWLTSRPVELELEAIRTATDLAGETGCSLHIVHVSSPEGVALAREAKARGVDVSIETCPHYLLLTQEDVVSRGAPAKCFPPLRTEEQRLGLWGCLESGAIDTVGSDHSPAPPAMKRSDDFFLNWGGISGCQHAFGLLISEALTRQDAGVALPRLTALLSENVARRFRIDRTKGRIAEGFDADLTLLEVGPGHILSNKELLYRHRQGPYDGRQSRIGIARTVVRGGTIFSKGRIAPGRAAGKFIAPART